MKSQLQCLGAFSSHFYQLLMDADRLYGAQFASEKVVSAFRLIGCFCFLGCPSLVSCGEKACRYPASEQLLDSIQWFWV